MAQGHRFKSEWPSEAPSGARRSHSGRFGVVRQAVVEWPPFAFLSKTDSRSRGRIEHTTQTLLLDVASRIDHSWPGCRGASDRRSHVRDRLRAAILQRPREG